MINWYRNILYGKQVSAEEGLSDPDQVTRYRELLTDPNGILFATLAVDDSAVALVNPNSDGKASTDLLGLATSSVNYLFNETNFDRQRNNTEASIFASAARAATVNSGDQTNYNARGCHLVTNVTSISAGSITPRIEGKDPVSGTYYDIAVSGAITTTGINILKLYPGIQPVANGAFSDILPRTFRITVTHSTGNSITYSVGLSLVV